MSEVSPEVRLSALKKLTKDEAFCVRLVEYFPQIQSTRELEVLYFILNFYSNNEIAEKLLLAIQTVKWHNTAIFKKIKVRNRRELLSLFYESPSNQAVKRAHRIRNEPEQGPQYDLDTQDDMDVILPFTRPLNVN